MKKNEYTISAGQKRDKKREYGTDFGVFSSLKMLFSHSFCYSVPNASRLSQKFAGQEKRFYLCSVK